MVVVNIIVEHHVIAGNIVVYITIVMYEIQYEIFFAGIKVSIWKSITNSLIWFCSRHKSTDYHKMVICHILIAAMYINSSFILLTEFFARIWLQHHSLIRLTGYQKIFKCALATLFPSLKLVCLFVAY